MKRDWLIRMRNERNYTQEQVAEKIGIERSTYTKLENGSIPSVKVARKAAIFFDVDWTDFYEK